MTLGLLVSEDAFYCLFYTFLLVPLLVLCMISIVVLLPFVPSGSTLVALFTCTGPFTSFPNHISNFFRGMRLKRLFSNDQSYRLLLYGVLSVSLLLSIIMGVQVLTQCPSLCSDRAYMGWFSIMGMELITMNILYQMIVWDVLDQLIVWSLEYSSLRTIEPLVVYVGHGVPINPRWNSDRSSFRRDYLQRYRRNRGYIHMEPPPLSLYEYRSFPPGAPISSNIGL